MQVSHWRQHCKHSASTLFATWLRSIEENLKHLFTFSGCSNLTCTPQQWMGSLLLKAIMELIVKIISGLLLASKRGKPCVRPFSTGVYLVWLQGIIACFGFWHLNGCRYQYLVRKKNDEVLNEYFVKMIWQYKAGSFSSYIDHGHRLVLSCPGRITLGQARANCGPGGHMWSVKILNLVGPTCSKTRNRKS